MDIVRKAAKDLIGLGSEPHNIAGARGLTAGALYSLALARALDSSPTFPGRRREFASEIDQVLASIANGESVDQVRWLAGFHFNSALFRLAFAAERALKLLLNASQDDTFVQVIDAAESAKAITAEEAKSLHKLRCDVNLVKHNPTEWRQGQIQTLEEAESLVPLVQNLISRQSRSDAD